MNTRPFRMISLMAVVATVFGMTIFGVTIWPLVQPYLLPAYKYLPFVLAIFLSAYLTWRFWLIKPRRAWIVTVAVLLFSTPVWLFSVSFVEPLNQWSIALSLQPENLDLLPVSKDSRALNKATATIYAQNSNHESLLRAGHPHITADMKDPLHPRMWWQVPFYYREGLNYFMGSVSKIVRIDADNPGMSVDLHSGEAAQFYFGEESYFVRTLFAMRLPLSRPSHAQYYLKADGTWTLLIPAISYKLSVTGAMIPYFASVLEVLPSGWYNVWSPEEAGRNFPGAPLFPLELGRLYAESYGKFKSGLVNYYDTVLGRNNIYEVSEDSVAGGYSPDDVHVAADNRFPFYQVFEGLGLTQMIPLEPVGPSFALSEVLLFDGGTGAVRSYIPGAEFSLNGPRKAEKQVWTALPTFPHEKYKAVEARIKTGADGKVYWLFTVVNITADQSVFAKLVLVDARELTPFAFDSQESVDSFLRGPN